MSTHNHFDDDNDSTDDERGTAADGAGSANAPGTADAPDSTGHAADADDDIEVEVDEFVDVDDRPIDHEVTSEDAPNLARLLRQAGRSLRREFLSAVADEDIDPRDVADLRRRGRHHRHFEGVADGGVWAESDHGDDADGVDPDELRDRVRALRDRVSAKVEDILTADEVASMSESLTKIIDALGGDDDDIRTMREFARGRGFGPGRGSDGRRGHGHHRGPGEGHHRDFARDDSDSAGPRDHRGSHDHSDRRRGDGPRGYDDFGDDFDPRMLFRRGARRGGPRGGGRGFGPGNGPGPRGEGRGPRDGERGSRSFGPWGGFGPGGPREGFDADCDPRMLFAQWLRGASGRGREDAYERGFAAGFAQGQRSAQQTDSRD